MSPTSATCLDVRMSLIYCFFGYNPEIFFIHWDNSSRQYFLTMISKWQKQADTLEVQQLSGMSLTKDWG
jgi:hypothetical protein